MRHAMDRMPPALLLPLLLSLGGCPWQYGPPRCGDGTLDAGAGEACDPPNAVAQCPSGESCKAGCMCAPRCHCCASAPSRLVLTHRPSGGACGKVTYLDGSTRPLDCGTLYFGGGGNSVPFPLLPEITSNFAVTGCDAQTETMTLGPTTLADTKNFSTCTTDECQFGAPVAIPNSHSTATSACLLLQVGAGTTGTSSCDGMLNVLMPLRGRLFLTGDLLPTVPGIQPCPLCVSGTCQGGLANGKSCKPQTSDLGDSYPTSNDCPPFPATQIGVIPLMAHMTNSTAINAARESGTQKRVFCGFCRDADGTGGFDNPPTACWPYPPLLSCVQPFESCEQRNQGAFGPAGGGAELIQLNGTPSGCLEDRARHSATTVVGMCVVPTFNATVDAVSDLPGPAAFSLTGELQIQ
jgi:hypothetical protein